MSTLHCPHCDALLPSQEAADGRCRNCGMEFPRDAIADATGLKAADDIPTLREVFDSPAERSQRPPLRQRDGSGVGCPKCGSRSVRSGPWPWYLGTIGAMLCRAVICNDCGHEFDARKPKANLATRKLTLALAINGIGLLGILGVIGGLALWIWFVFTH
jgi:DNA-directed RNA polymerase subunit M/transcription elongation factor TFIIS